MEAITRDIRKVMKLLKEGNKVVLNGVFMSYENDNKFKIEYVYNGENKVYYQKRNWIINFIKKDYLNQDLYLVKAA
jgi:hypothetical protein